MTDDGLDLQTRTNSFLHVMFRDGYLRMLRPDNRKGPRRDEFVTSLRKFLDIHQLEGLVDESAFVTTANTERAYHAILDALAVAIEGCSEAEAFWVAIAIFNTQAIHVSTAATEVTNESGPVVDPVNRKLPIGPGGLEVNPDDILPALMSNLANTLKMFAYRNNWFDKTGLLVAPVPVTGTPFTNDKAGRLIDLATIWGEVSRADATCRYFGGKTTLRDSDGTTGGSESEMIEFSFADNHDIDLHVSANRRATKLFGIFADLSPQGFIDRDEAVFAFALSDYLCKPIHKVESRFAGLTLTEWIRGYAVLSQLARNNIAEHEARACVAIDDAHLVKVLMHYGFGEQEGEMFIQRVTFHRDTADMADAPLIRCSDGTLCFVCGMAAYTNLSQAVLSQLATHGCDLAWKGTTFENAVLELLEKHSLESHQIHRTVNGEEIEIDRVLLWDGFLFVFELKNRSLPSSNPQNEHWFIKEQARARQQVLRKVANLKTHPTLLNDAFGRSEDWEKLTVVPVVLNSVPYSVIGEREGVYTYDASALHRFLDTGKVGLAEVKEGPIAETETSLWAGDKPTPEDLMKQLEAPIQVTRLRGLYSVTNQSFVVDDSLTVSIPMMNRAAARVNLPT
ncbi:MAG: NERD domain-containing protein [Fuerstiella sp.]